MRSNFFKTENKFYIKFFTGGTAGSDPIANDPRSTQYRGTSDDYVGPCSLTSLSSSSDKCMSDSRFSDSGCFSGSNIHSEELDTPDSPVSKSSAFTYPPDMKAKISESVNISNTRLDSGIDISVSQQLSELSLTQDQSDNLNDLSSKSKPKDSTTNINLQKSSSQITSPQYPALLQKCFQPNEDGDT